MNDSYVECLVKAKPSIGGVILKYLLIVLTVLCVGFTILGYSIALILGVVFGVLAYFATLRTDLEYEYLYVDKEISIDKIMAKSKRKNVGHYTLDRIEVVAPIKSYHLDDFKNRDVKVLDYSVGEERQPDLRYVLYYEGGIKLILSPSEEMIKVLKNYAPRKVFSE